MAVLLVKDSAGFHPTELALGILAAMVAFFAKELFGETKRRRQRYFEASNVLLRASDEVNFYAGKLGQLVSDIDANLLSLKKGAFVVPSYSLYPEFIVNLGAGLTDRRVIRPDLFGSVGECHLELAHLSRRLEDGKGRTVPLIQKLEANRSSSRSLSDEDKNAIATYSGNWRGVQQLARGEDHRRTAQRLCSTTLTPGERLPRQKGSSLLRVIACTVQAMLAETAKVHRRTLRNAKVCEWDPLAVNSLAHNQFRQIVRVRGGCFPS